MYVVQYGCLYIETFHMSASNDKTPRPFITILLTIASTISFCIILNLSQDTGWSLAGILGLMVSGVFAICSAIATFWKKYAQLSLRVFAFTIFLIFAGYLVATVFFMDSLPEISGPSSPSRWRAAGAFLMFGIPALLYALRSKPKIDQ